MLDRAYCFEQLGDLRRAEEAYRHAAELDASGEAQFCLARFTTVWGKRDLAATMLTRALRLAPAFALEVEADPEEWRSLADHPEVKQAIRRALERCD